MGLLGGAGDVAAHLARVLVAAANEGHHRRRLVAPLFLHHGEVHRARVDARRRAGLEPADVERQFPQPARQCIRRRVTGTTAGVALQADVDHAP